MRYTLLIVIVCMAFLGKAQDQQYTQFYAAPLYLNPAFTGVNACSRLTTNYRDQWPAIPGAFVSYAISYDHHFTNIKSGLGFILNNDQAGSGQLRTRNYSGLYAYETQVSKKWMARGGVQAGYTVRSLNVSNLVFGDQIARGGVSGSVDVTGVPSTGFFDFASGVLFYSERYWLGLAGHHLTRPNETMNGTISRLPLKYSLHGGAKIPIITDEKDKTDFKTRYLYTAFNYKAQGEFDQVDIGAYYNYKAFILGLWYRGIPLLKAYKPGYGNHDAVALIAGLIVGQMKIGYSYDFTISRLAFSSGNAHELSLSYNFCDTKTKKKRKPKLAIPCPKF